MSQFGFGQQIGQQRDALGGSSRSNYASEEADLTDGLIKQVESIDIPNTNQFYENIKFVEKVKEQGNFLNTMKQLASTFEAGARFKTAFDAMQAKKDSIASVTGEKGKTAGGTSFDAIAEAATVTTEEIETDNKQIDDTNVELENEKNETDSAQFKNDITALQLNMLEVKEGLNMRQIGNEIEGSIQALYNVETAKSGLDKVNTTGEAEEFLGVEGITGRIIDGIFFEYAEKGVDITNPRIQRRILAKHAKTLNNARKAALTTWSTNLRAKVKDGLVADHTAGVYENTATGNANSMWGDNGMVAQANTL